MKRFATDEHPTVVVVPGVARVGVIAVQPAVAVVVTFDVEHVRVTVAVRDMYEVPSMPPPLECSRGCIECGIAIP